MDLPRLLFLVLLQSSTCWSLSLPSWLGGFGSPVTKGLVDPKPSTAKGRSHPKIEHLDLPSMPQQKLKKVQKGPVSAQGQKPAKPHLGSPYVCKFRTAGDLLEKALQRIGGSLFLFRERLDHFKGENEFDEEFASKYLYMNWMNYTAARGINIYDRCAVVGNSGHLGKTLYGWNIDTFDAVIRTNQAPTKGYFVRVGRNTTFRLINRAMARRYMESMDERLRRLKKIKMSIDAYLAKKRTNLSAKSGAEIRRIIASDRKVSVLADCPILKRVGISATMLARISKERAVLDRLRTITEAIGASDVRISGIGRFPMEKNVTVVLVTEVTSLREEMQMFIRASRNLRPDVKVMIQSGKARKVIEDMLDIWKTRLTACFGLDTREEHGGRATTGILATMVMMKQCRSVTLYGFGPPSANSTGSGFHYYKGLLNRNFTSASNTVHSFSGEYRFLRKLQEEGYLQICSDQDDEACGVPPDLIPTRPTPSAEGVGDTTAEADAEAEEEDGGADPTLVPEDEGLAPE